MDRRKFTFGTLIGLVGIKAIAQEPVTNNGPLTFVLEPSSCSGLDFKKTKCAPGEGEEYCPIGHVQKPEDGPNYKQIGMAGDIPLFANLHICSICGIVYVPKETK
jgi:hypothetical protein